MYERFTDRSRKVMLFSQQEAQRFNHEYIGTEHILLGLIKESSGIAANVLKNLHVDLRQVRLKVETLVQSGPEFSITGRLPQSPRAKKVIEYAMDEARSLNHNYVGTEHILLGLLKDPESVACTVLTSFGLKLETVQNEILNLLGCTDSPKYKEAMHKITRIIAESFCGADPKLSLIGIHEIAEETLHPKE